MVPTNPMMHASTLPKGALQSFNGSRRDLEASANLQKSGQCTTEWEDTLENQEDFKISSDAFTTHENKYTIGFQRWLK